ncbi:ankyrin repeat domain-containing protein [Spirillospora sp. CA-255316]
MGRSGPRPGTAACRPFGRKIAGYWERERRYGVPRWRIERATERRLAGDWRGACREAGVPVGFDLARVADECGAEAAEALEHDLLHLAPDLLRWHLGGDSGQYVLATYGEFGLHAGRSHGSGRPELGFGPVSAELFVAPRHMWDVRGAGELMARHGGAGRVPFFEADGKLRGDPGAPGGGPVERAERASLLHEAGHVEEAFAEAGIELRLPEDAREEVARLPLALHRIEAELRRLGGGRFVVKHSMSPAHGLTVPAEVTLVLEARDAGVRATYARYDRGVGRRLPEAFWHRSPDLDLVRARRFTPDDLHPLVRSTFFPERDAGAGGGPEDSPPPGVARVRCRGDWHEVSFERGVLRVHAHTEEERRREDGLAALGGAVAGCFAVRRTWNGAGFLPRRLREQRTELFDLVELGDAEGVLRLLDMGYDPHVRDQEGRTLLHCLDRLEHTVLLRRLLESGIDLEARDGWGRTPLLAAVGGGVAAWAVRALVEAGARTDARRSGHVRTGRTVPEIIRDRGRTDLDFLR